MVFILSVFTRIVKNFFPSFQGTTDFSEAWNRSKKRTQIIDRRKIDIDLARMCGRSTPSDGEYTNSNNKIRIDDIDEKDIIDVPYTLIIQKGDVYIEVGDNLENNRYFRILDNPPDPSEITTVELIPHPDLDK
jgi:hypothetical protein